MRLPIVIVSMILLSGCSTTFVTPENATAVPSERILYQGEGESQITVIRDRGHIGSGCYAKLSINGAKAALFETKEKATFNVESGSILLGVELTGDGICTWDAQQFNTETILKPNEHGIYRIFTGQYSGGPVIQPVSKS